MRLRACIAFARLAATPASPARMDVDPPPRPIWPPAAAHGARRGRLLTRGRIVHAVRAWFAEREFTEVETAALGVSPGNEAHLHAFSTALEAPDGRARPLHLRTSPEFAAKGLLAAGEARIFELARVWRNRERGRLHHPEFTMLEWYRAGEPHTAVMDDAAALCRLAAATAGARCFTWNGRACDPCAEPEVLTVADAFAREGIDLLATVTSAGATDRDALAAQAGAAGVRIAEDDTWSDVFSKVLAGRIEPTLGNGRLTLLTQYPRPEAALARADAEDPRVAERFELYACGVELANGFGELTDPVEQRTRLEAEMAEMQRVYGRRYPVDEAFLAALAHMPAASGCALGLDRLVVLATGARGIEDVLWTPLPE